MSRLINGIHHISMKSKDTAEYEKALDFYTNILELNVIRVWENGVMIDTGNSVIEIFRNADEQLPKGVIRHFAFCVNNVDALTDKLKKHGYKITTEPKDIVINSEIPLPARIAFCEGPLGEEIEFFCEK